MNTVYVVRWIDIETSEIVGIYTDLDAAKQRALAYEPRYSKLSHEWVDGENGFNGIVTVDAYPLDTPITGEWDEGYAMIGYAR